MRIIETMIRAVDDLIQGHKLVQQKKKAFAYDLMEQGICLTPEEDKVLQICQKGIDKCNQLIREVTREFSN